MPIYKRGWVVVALVLAAACGSSPTAPSSVNITGTWTGTLNSSVGSFPFVMTVNQTANGTVGGSYTASIFAGTVSGNVSPDKGATTGYALSATFYLLGAGTYGACGGQFTLFSAASTSRMTINAPNNNIVGSNCTSLPRNLWIQVTYAGA